MQREVRAAGATTSVSSRSQEVEQNAEKYLTLRLGSDTYVVPFRHVREIMGMQEIKAVPGAAVFLKGVINLRGKLLPVVDLRLKFGFFERACQRRTCIVIVQIEDSISGKLTMGMIVDSVAEVLTLRAGDFRNGSVKVKSKVNNLLNLDMLLSADEMHILRAVCN